MATSLPQIAHLGYTPSLDKRGTSFGDRFLTEAKDIAIGLPQGLAMLGSSVARDLTTPHRTPTTPAMLKGMGNVFMEESFIPSLATGHPVEAWNRFSARPASGMLDLGGLVFGGARLAQSAAQTGRFGEGAARLAGMRPVEHVPMDFITDPYLSQSVGATKGVESIAQGIPMYRAGQQMSDRMHIPQIKSPRGIVAPKVPLAEGGFAGGKTVRMPDGSLWRRKNYREVRANAKMNLRVGRLYDESGQARRTKELYDQVANRLYYYRPRSNNELAARMGDTIEEFRRKIIPNSWRFIGNEQRINRWQTKSGPAELMKYIQETRRAREKEDALFYEGLEGKPGDEMWEAGKKKRDAALFLRRQGYMDPYGYVTDVSRLTGGESIAEAARSVAELRKTFNDEVLAAAEWAGQRGIYPSHPLGKQLDPHLFKKIEDGSFEFTDVPEELRGAVYEKTMRIFDAQRKLDQAEHVLGLMRKTRKRLGVVDKTPEEIRNIMSTSKDPLAVRARWVLENGEELGELMHDARVTRYDDFVSTLMDEARKRESSDLYGYLSDHDYAFLGNRGRFALQGRLNPREIFNAEPDAYRLIQQFTPARVVGEKKIHVGAREGTSPFDRILERGDKSHWDLILEGRDSWDSSVFFDKLNESRRLYSDTKRIDNIEGSLVEVPWGKYLEDRRDGVVSLDIEGMDTPFVAVGGSNPVMTRVLRQREAIESIIRSHRAHGDNMPADLLDDFVQEHGPFQLSRLIRGAGYRIDSDEIHKAFKIGKDLGSQKVMYIPRSYYKALVRETVASDQFWLKWLDKPGDLFRNFVLQLRPTWYRNNAIGSYFLLAMASSNREAIRSIWRTSKSREKFNKLLFRKDEPAEFYPFFKTADGKGALTYREYLKQSQPQVLGGGTTAVALKGLDVDPAGTLVGRKWDRYMNQMIDFNARWADDPYRLARIDQVVSELVDNVEETLRAHPNMVPENMPSREMIVQRILMDDDLRGHIAERVLGDMIDFSDLSRTERAFIRRMYPFISWLKGATKIGGRSLYESPGKLWTQAQLGKAGQERLREDQGMLPSFLRTGISLGKGRDMIPLGGAMPLVTPIEVAHAGLSMVPLVGARGPQGLSALAGGLLPPVKALGQVVSGKDFYYGTPLPRDRTAGSLWLEQTFDLPIASTTKNIFGGPFGLKRPSVRSTTMTPPWWKAALSYAGLPMVTVKPVQARDRAIEERRELLG